MLIPLNSRASLTKRRAIVVLISYHPVLWRGLPGNSPTTCVVRNGLRTWGVDCLYLDNLLNPADSNLIRKLNLTFGSIAFEVGLGCRRGSVLGFFDRCDRMKFYVRINSRIAAALQNYRWLNSTQPKCEVLPGQTCGRRDALLSALRYKKCWAVGNKSNLILR